MSEVINTREGIEQDYKYLMFDFLYEKVLAGLITMEQLPEQYARCIEPTHIAD